MLVIFIQLKAVIWIDGEERCDLVGHSNFFYTHVVSNNHQRSPTNTQLLVLMN